MHANEDGSLQPTRPDQRLLHMDVLRGFALLGILLVNFQYFTRPIQNVVIGPDADLTGIDLAANWLVMALAEGKFYPLFSMLFGAGFALIAEHAQQAGRGFRGLYFRRLVVLTGFGLVHLLLVWSGDILLVYSLVGFLMMLLFSRTPQSRLPKWGIFFIAIPVLAMALFALGFEASKLDADAHQQWLTEMRQQEESTLREIARATAAYSEGGYIQAVRQRVSDLGFLFGNAVWWTPPILGFFLLGRWLLVSGRLRDPAAYSVSLRRFMLWGFGAGLPLCLTATWLIYGLGYMQISARLGLGMMLAAAGAALLALGYLAAVTLNAARLRFLAPAGRMALSNYLLQSLFWTWMFYGHGLGLWGQVPRGLQVLLAFVFFGLQIAVSHWWMRRFRFGPAEWLWRSLTYLTPQPMRVPN